MRPCFFVAVVMVSSTLGWACGDDSAVPIRDGGDRDSGATVCTSDSTCDNGAYCDGNETCVPDAAGADGRGCVSGSPPCSGDAMCDEGADRCVGDCETMGDEDGDGHVSMVCGGDDCDDSDPLVYTGAIETCDPMNRDEDCDPNTFGFRDGDGDGFPDARCCNGATCGTDCDDTLPGVHPGLPEVCDGFDNDCDTNIDEGVLRTFYPDEDGDSFGSDDPAAVTVMGCNPPMGYSENNLDCDDSTRDVNPVRPEICDAAMVDENCDGMANPDCSCTVGESRACARPGRCAAGIETCASSTWGACSIDPVAEICNSEDDDCDGSIDEGLLITCYADGDNDGYPGSGAAPSSVCPVPLREMVGGCPTGTSNRVPAGANVDCNDGNPTISPAATEICIPDTVPIDENCNGMVDEGVAVTCYTDADNDTYAPMGAVGQSRCRDSSRPVVGFCPTGFTNRAPTTGNRDCVDSNFSINPGRPEVCDGMNDENCSGVVDEGCSCATGMSRMCPLPGVCAMGMQTCNAGAWGICSIMPGTEACNGVDDDCDGTIDEGVTITCYTDNDNDTYAPLGAATTNVCGACGADLTFRAPTGMNLDCDDDAADTHPGALEVCNRVDNNCSSGGGIDLLEDADGDGHTAVGFAGCDTGFPKDDCNDNDSRVFPGQTTFFGTPSCNGATCTCSSPTRLGCQITIPFSACLCSSTLVSQWDFNCDGTVQRHPEGCLSICGGPITTCGTTGPVVAAGECGQSVAHQTSCGSCPSCTPSRFTISRPRGCR